MYSYAPFTTLLPTVLPSLEPTTTQLDILYTICHQPSTGLLVHGYDAAKSHPWADPVTGAAPLVWSRSIGWYTVGLVDALAIVQQYFPHLEHTGASFTDLRKKFNDLASAEIKAVQRTAQATGRSALYQVVTQPKTHSNFVESSGTALIAYALAKGVNTGLLQGKALQESAACTARDMLDDLVTNFVIENRNNGTLSFNGTSSVASLSGAVVDFEYYVTRPITLNSLIGTSAFVLAASEVGKLKI